MMENINTTVIITEFILLGFTTDPKINAALFVLFFIIYLVTLAGNILIIYLFIYNPKLYKPMYFFLCLLSVHDLCCSTTTLPRLLADLFSTERTISYLGCALQIYVILVVNGSEFQLLAVMAYDRYIAICHPLHYPVLLRWANCYKIMTVIFIYAFILNVVPSLCSQMPLCSNQINHFMCEFIALVKLACGDISTGQLQIFFFSMLSLLPPLVLILLSYACIIHSILKIRSAGRSKAFSTCTSHLVVVILSYGTAMLLYCGPSSAYSTDQEKYTSMCYVIITPMLNPLIYSLNNREVKDAFKKVLKNA